MKVSTGAEEEKGSCSSLKTEGDVWRKDVAAFPMFPLFAADAASSSSPVEKFSIIFLCHSSIGVFFDRGSSASSSSEIYFSILRLPSNFSSSLSLPSISISFPPPPPPLAASDRAIDLRVSHKLPSPPSLSPEMFRSVFPSAKRSPPKSLSTPLTPRPPLRPLSNPWRAADD